MGIADGRCWRRMGAQADWTDVRWGKIRFDTADAEWLAAYVQP